VTAAERANLNQNKLPYILRFYQKRRSFSLVATEENNNA